MTTVVSPALQLRYAIERTREDWTLQEEPMPESRPHDLTIDLLKAILTYWAARGRGLQVGRNLAVRWDEAHPAFGIDPDIYVADVPPEGDAVTSLRLWEPGHHAPIVAVEVVSAGAPRKDYESAPEKYALSGTGELWVFDPMLAGPRVRGGPHRLQVWVRSDDGAFERTYAGPGPVWSAAVGGFLRSFDEGARLRVTEDEQGTSLWPTAEEAERAAKEVERAAKDAERAAKDAERAAKEAALTRLAELEAELARLRSG